MRLLGLDFETTGLDPKTDRVTEVGLVLCEAGHADPLVTYGFLIKDSTIPPLSAEIKALTGITNDMLTEFGNMPSYVFYCMDSVCKIHKVDFIVAHNGTSFDKLFLQAELDRHSLSCNTLRDLEWIDTKVDIPHAVAPDSNKLKHLLAEKRMFNPFAHRAVFDAAYMMWYLAQFDIEDVLEYRARPNIVIRALVPHPRTDNGKGKDAAKAAGFRWQEINYKKYENCWVKMIKEDELDAETKKLPDYALVKIG